MVGAGSPALKDPIESKSHLWVCPGASDVSYIREAAADQRSSGVKIAKTGAKTFLEGNNSTGRTRAQLRKTEVGSGSHIRMKRPTAGVEGFTCGDLGNIGLDKTHITQASFSLRESARGRGSAGRARFYTSPTTNQPGRKHSYVSYTEPRF